MKNTTFFALLLLAALLLGACQAAPQPADVYPSADSYPSYGSSSESIPASTAEPTREVPLSTTPLAESSTGEYPPAALAAREALAETLDVSPESIEIQTSQPAEWPDGCLGLGGPGEMCTQALVTGYRVTLLAGGVQYVYRTNQSGNSLRREGGLPRGASSAVARAVVNWQSPQCDREVNLLPEGLSVGACGGPYRLVRWEDGSIPPQMLTWLDTYASFKANTPAGRLIFKGKGAAAASPAEQRALAEWLYIQFLTAQSKRPSEQEDIGLALSYQRTGGFVGFCDELKVYLDGYALLSSCKDVDVDFRLNSAQLEQLYDWYDTLAAVEFSHTDPAVNDALSIALTMPSQGSQLAGEDVINALQDFCAALIQQGRAVP